MYLQRFYDMSPVFIQNLMCSVKGWIICNRRYNTDFHSELSRYLNKKIRLEEELLHFLLLTKHVPAYGGVLSDEDYLNLKSGVQSVYDILSKFPIIDKQTVKADIEGYTNSLYEGKKIIMHTSGTTGSGLIFPYSVEMENKQWAIWWRYRINLGLSLDTWCGWFGGKTIINPRNKKKPYWRINTPGRQVMFSTYHLSKETVTCYCDEIEKRHLTWIHGYPSSVSLLASLMIENHVDPVDCVKFITTGAENLYDYQISLMKRAFPNAIIRQHYGLSEGVANFSQNINGDWSIDDDFCYVELIPVSDDNPNLCRIIGTGFSNRAFPLIRYDTGDLVYVERKNGVIRIVSFEGRKEDFITLSDGVRLGPLNQIFKNCENIKEAQIQQKSLTHIVFRIVKGDEFQVKDENILKNEISKRISSSVSVKIEIVYVDKIERTKAGKLKLVVSEI